MKLIPPQYVKPYVKSQKNDATDAEAICEAMSRPGMRFVAVKTVEQQDIQAIHRVRSSLIGRRTAKGNQTRGLVAEYGLVAPKDLGPLRRAIPDWLEDAGNGLTARFRVLLQGLWEELRSLDERLRPSACTFRQTSACRRVFHCSRAPSLLPTQGGMNFRDPQVNNCNSSALTSCNGHGEKSVSCCFIWSG